MPRGHTTLVKIIENFVPKTLNIFLSFSLNMSFGCSKKPSHLDSSFEYPQHMLWLRNKKIIFNYALLSGVLTAVFDDVFTIVSKDGIFFSFKITLLFLLGTE